MAPEANIGPWLKTLSDDYVSGDIDGELAMEVMDLTNLPLADRSRSLVYCSHVLEHIQDDDAAMREMHRVLEEGGVAVVQVPIGDGPTDEDPSVVSPTERERRWLQWNHVRLYGLDIVKRLEQVGFDVVTLSVDDLDRDVVERHSLAGATTNEIFVCTRTT
jgi:SAM-dependent methyltransferase